MQAVVSGPEYRRELSGPGCRRELSGPGPGAVRPGVQAVVSGPEYRRELSDPAYRRELSGPGPGAVRPGVQAGLLVMISTFLFQFSIILEIERDCPHPCKQILKRVILIG